MLFGRLVAASVTGMLAAPARVELAQIAAARAVALDDSGQEEAAEAFVLPALPVLLTGDVDVAVDWLLWWHEGGNSLPARPSPDWGTAMAIALLTLRIRTRAPGSVGIPAAPLADDPPSGPVSEHDAAGVAGALLVDLFRPPAFPTAVVLARVRNWVAAGDDSVSDAGRATRAAEALATVPSLPGDDPRRRSVERHRAVLLLWQEWVLDGRPAEDPAHRARAAGQVLRSAAARGLRQTDHLTVQVLCSLAIAWCRGRRAFEGMQQAVVATLLDAIDNLAPVREAVTDVLRSRPWSAEVSWPLLPAFRDDLVTLAGHVEFSVNRHPDYFDAVVDLLLAGLRTPGIARAEDTALPEVAASLVRALVAVKLKQHVTAPDRIHVVTDALCALGLEPGAGPGARESLAVLAALPAVPESVAIGSTLPTPREPGRDSSPILDDRR